MSHHHAGMHPRIGAAGTCYTHGLTQQGSERILQYLLHTHGIRLHLPTVVVCSVVGESDKIAHENLGKNRGVT